MQQSTRRSREFIFERLLSYADVQSDPKKCWLWKGTLNNYGYGRLNANSRWFLAHRLSYTFFHGPIPAGLFVCHHCDVRNCINPAHLFLGTNQDNQDDCIRKGRARKAHGQSHYRAKLTDTNVREIQARIDQGEEQKLLASEYHVCRATICHINKHRNWKHLTL